MIIKIQRQLIKSKPKKKIKKKKKENAVNPKEKNVAHIAW